MDFTAILDDASNEVSKEDLERVEKVLRDDVRWAVLSNTWDPGLGARCVAGKWVPTPNNYGQACGVCAIGAHVLRAQPAPDSPESLEDVTHAARSLGVSVDFVWEVYWAVAHEPSCDDENDDENYCNHEHRSIEPSQGEALGYRLRDFADALLAGKEVLPEQT